MDESLSLGSYDDVKRQELQRLMQAYVVVESKPTANISNPTRGYQINDEYSKIMKHYGDSDWSGQVDIFNKSHKTYQERLSEVRDLPRLMVTTPDGKEISLKDGEHNLIQKQIIEEFLPRFGYGAEVLYCGDSDNKFGVIFEKENLMQLGFTDITQSVLPDVIAYSREKDWIYLIEAYHTSNPITPQRKINLEEILGDAVDKAIFITAFANNKSYADCQDELAWETEVWIATSPDHVIHRDGYRFMGPYAKMKEGEES